MEIYVDVLLVTNYIINVLLLRCLGRFAGHRLRPLRLTLAALLGALGSLSIFLPLTGVMQSILYQLMLSGLMVRVAVRFHGLRGYLQDWLLFFVASFLFAGMMLGIWMLLRPRGMLYYNGIVYFDISATVLLVTTVAAYVLSGLFWRISQKGRIRQQEYRVRIRLRGRTAELTGFVDSGNRLREPFSGSPVAVCRYQALRPLFSDEMAAALECGDFETASKTGMKLRFVPYTVVGGRGVLPAFRADDILLEGGDVPRRVEELYLGISPEEIRYDILLHPDVAGSSQQIEKTVV